MKLKYYLKSFLVLFLYVVLISFCIKFFNKEAIKIDLSGSSLSTLSKRTKDFLKNTNRKIKINYYISGYDKLPSSQMDLRSGVREILESLKKYSEGKLKYNIINTDNNPDSKARLIQNHITPFTVETIKRDNYTTHSIWSAMLIDYKGKTKKIPYILTEHLPHLQERIISLCSQIDKKTRPVIGVLGSKLNRYTNAFSQMAGHGRVLISDIQRNEDVPEDADLLFVINPDNFSEKHIDFIKNFISDGKQVFVYFNTFRIIETRNKNTDRHLVNYTSKIFTDYLQSIGVIPLKMAVMDENFYRRTSTEKQKIPEDEIDDNLKKFITDLRRSGMNTQEILDKMSDSLAEAKDEGLYLREPFGLNVNPSRIYLNQFYLKRAGRIYMTNAAPLKIDKKKLYESGFNYEPIITSPEDSVFFRLPENDGILSLRREKSIKGEHNIKIMSLVLLPRKKWNGKLFLFPSASILENRSMSVGGNRNLLRNILITYTKPDNLTSIKFSREEKLRIPELSISQRMIYRLFVVFFIPLFIFAAGVYNDIFRFRSGMIVDRFIEKTKTAEKKIPALLNKAYAKSRFFIIFIAALTAANAVENTNIKTDISIQKQSNVSPYTKNIFSSIKKPVDIIFITSREKDLSFKGKQLLKQVGFWLEQAKKYSDNINFKITKIKQESKIDKSTENMLNKYRIGTFKMRTIIQDQYIEKNVYSSLIFKSSENTEVIRNIYPDEINRLEFTFASAIKRLLSGKSPKIAIVTEEERLSTAEEYHDYMQKHRIQPKFPDYFSDLKDILENHGYEVETVNSRSNNNFSADLIFVLQPRILSEFIKKKFNQHLISGRKAIVACQHYQIVPRRYRGRDNFGTVYWPRPYFTRINELLDPYGIELKKEVLLDENSIELDIKGQIRWGGNLGIMEKTTDTSEPFLIKASAVNFNKDSLITSQLSDQFFIFGNRLVKKANFPQSLYWEKQIETSDKVWAINWKGGFLTAESFKERDYFKNKQPLAVLVNGKFPPLEGNTSKEVPKGELLLTGNSVMFKNYYLTMPRFEHKNFLLNSIAYLTYDRDIAKLQAKSFIPKKGFVLVDFKKKLIYRFFTVFFPCILIAGLGLIRLLLEKKRKTTPFRHRKEYKAQPLIKNQ